MIVTVKKTQTTVEEIDFSKGYYLLKAGGGWPKALAYAGGQYAMLVVVGTLEGSTSISISYIEALLSNYEIDRRISESEFMNQFMNGAGAIFEKFLDQE